MTKSGYQIRNQWMCAMITAAVMVSPAAFAQQQPAAADPYQGVSQPPPDDTIVANPDMPAQGQTAKPSPVVQASAPVPPPASYAPPATTAQGSNQDQGIVTSVPAPSAPQPAPPVAVLQERPGTDDGIVESVPSNPNQLPEGTNIRVRLSDRLSTKETANGSYFKAQVTADVSKDGRIIIPTGSELRGRVVGVTQGHHFGAAATLRLRPDMVLLPDGTAYHLYAQVAGSTAPDTRTDSEGGIQPKSHIVKNTVEYGVGAGTGALLGAHFGGPAGALLGAGVGAGVITVHLLLQHPDAAVLPSGSTVTFSLTEPMELTPTRN